MTWQNRVATAVGWVRNAELWVLLSVLVVVGGTWGFIELADEVVEGETQCIDEGILRAMRRPDAPEVPIGPEWMEEVGRDITALGGVAVLTMVTLVVVGFLCIRRLYHALWLVLAATVGGQILSSTLKYFFDRPRPSVVPQLADVYSASFPSGHSMLSAIVYLTLGALLVRLVAQWQLKVYILSVAIVLTLLIGISRVYLGVHYPTDVLAGWTAGLVSATLCWAVALYLQMHGAVEREGEAGA